MEADRQTGSTAVSSQSSAALHVCPLCRSSQQFTSTRVAIGGGVIYVCKQCTGYFLNPPQRVEYTGSKWTESRKKKWQRDLAVSHRFVPRILKTAERYLGRPVKTVLEVGCGSGFMGPAFAEAGLRYTGIEVDCDLARFAIEQGVDVRNVSAEQIGDKFEAKAFDLMISSNVFEHVNDPPRVFDNVARVCSGLAVIIVPNPRGLYMVLRANAVMQELIKRVLRSRRHSVYSIDGSWHNIAYTRQTLAYLCEQSGLKVLVNQPMGINHPTFGFVQPNYSRLYKAASGVAHLLRMDSENLLLARANPASADQ